MHAGVWYDNDVEGSSCDLPVGAGKGCAKNSGQCCLPNINQEMLSLGADSTFYVANLVT